MNILVTGGNGFVAPYLAKELTLHGHSVTLTGRESHTPQSFPYIPADLTDRSQVISLIERTGCDATVHLAGLSHVSKEEDRADLIWRVNVEATRFLAEAIKAQGKPHTFLFVSTGLVYKPDRGERFLGFSEDSSLGPVNDYGWSKLAAEASLQVYKDSHLRVYTVRPFNHTGPGQDQRFVAPALAKRIIDCVPGSTVKVGNLSAERDFCDVRDIVRAYRLVLEKQPTEHVFVLGSGKPVPISAIYEFFRTYSGKNIDTVVDKELLRAEHDVVYGQYRRAQEVLGWEPLIPLNQTLKELYDSLNR